MDLQNKLNPGLDLRFSLLHHETLIPPFTWAFMTLPLSRCLPELEDWYCNRQQMSSGEGEREMLEQLPVNHPGSSLCRQLRIRHTVNWSYITTADVRKSQEWGSAQPRMFHCSEHHPALKCVSPLWVKWGKNMGELRWAPPSCLSSVINCCIIRGHQVKTPLVITENL